MNWYGWVYRHGSSGWGEGSNWVVISYEALVVVVDWKCGIVGDRIATLKSIIFRLV